MMSCTARTHRLCTSCLSSLSVSVSVVERVSVSVSVSVSVHGDVRVDVSVLGEGAEPLWQGLGAKSRGKAGMHAPDCCPEGHLYGEWEVGTRCGTIAGQGCQFQREQQRFQTLDFDAGWITVKRPFKFLAELLTLVQFWLLVYS